MVMIHIYRLALDSNCTERYAGMAMSGRYSGWSDRAAPGLPWWITDETSDFPGSK